MNSRICMRGVANTKPLLAVVLGIVVIVVGMAIYFRWFHQHTTVTPALTSRVGSVSQASEHSVASSVAEMRGVKVPNRSVVTATANPAEEKQSFSDLKPTKEYDAMLEDVIPRFNGENGPAYLRLVQAIVHGRKVEVDAILDSGVSANTEVNMGSGSLGDGIFESLLEFAIAKGRPEIAKELVQRGASINQPADGGTLPLIFATENGETNLVSYLLDFGADIDRQDRRGMTALEVAIKIGSFDTTQLLLSRGASMSAALGPELKIPPVVANSQNAQYTAVRNLMIAHGARMPNQSPGTR